MIGAGSYINGFSKDFIRETWNRVNWMDIFHRWYLRYENNHLKDFKEFMLEIDPKKEFWNQM